MLVRTSLSRILSSTLKTFVALCILLVPGFGQTSINLQTQGRNPDFSAMPFTRPVEVGSAVPATCQIGQLFFNSSAAPGANIFGCTATNTWSSIGQTFALPLAVANGGTGLTSVTGLASGNGNCTLAGAWPNQTITCSNTTYNAGAGLMLSGNTFSLSGPISISNGGTGLSTVTGLTSGNGNCTLSGTWPNQTITCSNTTYNAGTGLTLSGNTFSLSAPVSIANGGTGLTTVTGLTSGNGNCTLSGSWPNQTITCTGNGNAAYNAGTGLTLSGNTFSLSTPVSVANGGTGLSSVTGLTSGNGNCTLSGTWPNQTITCTGNGNATYNAGTGLTLSGNTFSLSTPVSVANGGTGSTSPIGISSGNGNCTITGSFPNQTITCTGGSGGGSIPVQSNGSALGNASTINFASNLNASFSSGTVTVSASSSENGASLTSQLLDFAPAISSGTVTFGGTCSSTTPCYVTLGGARYAFTNSAVVAPASGTASDHLYAYVDTSGNFDVGYNSANTYSLTRATGYSGTSAFPAGVFPLYDCNVASGAVTSCSDDRPILAMSNYASGQGVSLTQSGGQILANRAELVDIVADAAYTVPGTACGHFEISTTTTARTWSLPQAGVGGMFPDGCVIAIKASGSGSIVLTPATSTINGSSSFTVASGHVCRVVSDGTNYQTEVCP